MISRLLLSLFLAICTATFSYAQDLALDEIVTRTSARLVIVQTVGSDTPGGTGYVLAVKDGQALIATARHTVEPAFSAGGALTEMRWAKTPPSCEEKFTAKSVHALERQGERAFDVAIMVADLECSPDFRAVPSAWREREPVQGSRFFALRLSGNPPSAQSVGPFWFADACLRANTCIDRKALTLRTQGTTEAGMSGTPVLTKAGMAGLVLGMDDVAAWPSVQVTERLCAGLQLANISGFDAGGLACKAAPTSAVISVRLLESAFDDDTTQGCDPRLGQELRDRAERGAAYKCRLEGLDQDWKKESARLDCREWNACRDRWFEVVARNGFPLGMEPPTEWLDLLNSIGLRDNYADIVLSNPDRIADFRAEFERNGFKGKLPSAQPKAVQNVQQPATNVKKCQLARDWPTYVHPDAKSGDLLADTMSVSENQVAASLSYGEIEDWKTKFSIWKIDDHKLTLAAVKENGNQATRWLPRATVNANYLFTVAIPIESTDPRAGDILATPLWRDDRPVGLDKVGPSNRYTTISYQNGWLAVIPFVRNDQAALFRVGDEAKITEVVDLDELAGRLVGGRTVAFKDGYLAIFGFDVGRSLGNSIDVFKREASTWTFVTSVATGNDKVLDIDVSSGRLAILLQRPGKVFVEIRDESAQFQPTILVPVDIAVAEDDGRDYASPDVLLASNLVVVSDPQWIDADDEEKMGALHVISVEPSSLGLEVTLIQSERRGWDSFGDELVLAGDTVLASGTHGPRVNTGEIVALDTAMLDGLLEGCSRSAFTPK